MVFPRRGAPKPTTLYRPRRECKDFHCASQLPSVKIKVGRAPRARNPPRPQQALANTLGPQRELQTPGRKKRSPQPRLNRQHLATTAPYTHAHQPPPREPDSQPSPRPSDRKNLPALPAPSSPVVASVMSWVQRTPLVRGPGEEGDVFDEEADESLLVQREWRSHMQRRVKVKLRGGCGREYPGLRGEGRGAVRSQGRESRGQSGPSPARRCPPYFCHPDPARIFHLKACETTGRVRRWKQSRIK